MNEREMKMEIFGIYLKEQVFVLGVEIQAHERPGREKEAFFFIPR